MPGHLRAPERQGYKQSVGWFSSLSSPKIKRAGPFTDSKGIYWILLCIKYWARLCESNLHQGKASALQDLTG